VRPTPLIVGTVAALLIAAAPAGAREYSVWAGCRGGAELLKPAKVEHCGHDVSYSLYADRIQWASFGDDQATGIGTAYVNPCDVSCDYGVWSANKRAQMQRRRSIGFLAPRRGHRQKGQTPMSVEALARLAARREPARVRHLGLTPMS